MLLYVFYLHFIKDFHILKTKKGVNINFDFLNVPSRWDFLSIDTFPEHKGAWKYKNCAHRKKNIINRYENQKLKKKKNAFPSHNN